MNKLVIFFVLCLQSLYGSSLDDYFSYSQKLGGAKGNFRKGEIEVVVDPAEIARIQKMQEERLLKKGLIASDAASWSKIGIINEDQYWVWLRDAVYFPKGIPGTYDRFVSKNELRSGVTGVAVLPVLPSNKIALNVNYRHATRSWELELPRGGIEPKETIEAAACREVQEETGLIVSSVIFLGNMAPDTGILSSVVPVFMGKISAEGQATPEFSEAISGIIAFTKQELEEGFSQGFVELFVEGKKQRVPLRDPFLTFALFQAQIRKLL